MKKLIAISVIVISSALCHAQSLTNFFSTAFNWATAFNTNNVVFLSTKGMFDTGAESRQGNGIALVNDVHGSYDLIGSTYMTPTNVTSFRLGPDALERNSGVTGIFVSGQGGIEAAFVHYDFRFGAAIDGGYWASQPGIRHSVFGEVALDANKGIGSTTFMGVRFAQDFPKNSQGYYIKFGFTF